MPIQEKCKVLNHEKIGSKYYKLTLVSPYISSHAEPGQFVEVKCSESYNPLLRRPLSLHRISKEHKTFMEYIMDNELIIVKKVILRLRKN